MMKEDLDYKIIACVERLSNALKVLLWERVKREKLSPIQIQFLLYLENHSEESCKVSNLANEFNLTQATVSDAIRILCEKGLVKKISSKEDLRVHILMLTPKGKKVVQSLKNWFLPVKKQLEIFSPEIKEIVMIFLMELIASLQKNGIINVARMCINCRYFKRNLHPNSKTPHRCMLTNKPLTPLDLRVDCENNELKI